ncbi:probable multidrug resistance-associated protein lethal(2)03659 isoform X2 [Bombus pyrosoma]|uniref:probable multidrug resistance-associated protein lethal(2)03659 isoform X2 n=1 Tax=Bombus pyrosoma TaxID=396416 RepID=UPI001CB8D3C1|nr:probable multidrug resistance-associated protein lethal(2)03659 isoform X2 [Bombus pyrosoma]
MDGKVKAERRKNPREGANPLSNITFAFTLPIFWTGYHRDLEVTDLYKTLKEHNSNYLGTKISKVWQKDYEAYRKQKLLNKEKGGSDESYTGRKKLKEPSLLKVLMKCFGLQLIFYGVIYAASDIVFRVMQPIFLGKLLRYYTDDGMTKQDAYLYAGGVILCSGVLIFITHPYMLGILHMGMKLRIACCTLIYRKALKLSRTALGETTVGQAVNLLSNDVNRFDVALIYLHYLWLGPLETIIITYFMYKEVELSAIFGVIILLLFIPLQAYLGKKTSAYRLKTALRTDERVRLTNEIISGIQAIKMYAWEKPFSNLIERARRREISVIRGMSLVRGITMSFIMFTTRMSLFITIVTYILYGHKITAEKVFMLQAYYNILRLNMTVYFPQGITQIAELLVSVRRLQKFMSYEEIDEENEKMKCKLKESKNDKGKNNANIIEEDIRDEKRKTTNYQGEYIMSLKNANVKWFSHDHEDTLKNININVKSGELIAVVGQVGSGKSSLLNVMLKELPLKSGTIEVNGKIAYASQEPWLFAGSVRQNILFGQKMDQFRYERVIKACQLKRDFTLLPYGDKTIVGERGISLSGGQRARINLARAVYAENDIYLLDDPLSAVDAHVGKHMFEECIVKYLRGKTRILATHQLQFLRNVDRIIILKDGKVEADGSYDELIAMGMDFGRLLENPAEEERPGSVPASRSNSRNASSTSLSSLKSSATEKEDPAEVAEARTKGKVSGKVYASYFKAGGNWCIVATIAMLCALAQTLASASDFFISQWVNMEEKYVNETKDGIVEDWRGPISRDVCMYVYTGLIVSTIIITLIRSVTFFSTCMRASTKLHDRMFRSISRATMRFFNTNPSGRVLNRFSKDMGAIDEVLPIALIDSLQIGLSLLGIIVVVAIANYWLLIPTVVIGIIFYCIRVFYLATSRSVKRLEGITRSPVFGHLSATLQGLPTVRAFGAEEILTKEFDQHQDLHSSAWYIFISSSRAFGFWLDFFCVIYIMLVTLSFLVQDDGTGQGGNIGLAITQSIGLTGMFQWGMRQSTELENQMTSVERVAEYSNVESEPPLESAPDKKPKESWPEEGKIEFKNVYMKYDAAEPPVLKNLNFVIYPQEKIGIVGRTGAGKSSLISTLFRLAQLDGVIEIDGVKINDIGLHDLRSKISIIPQEPFLYSGSMRSNLDPFNNYTDDVLWQALEEVELKEMGLDSHINEGGSNLSVGQRQLVCLARAIVKNNPILVLDEATANVDLRTDELIQKTIRSKFSTCTVLTIAHRLNTVMDSDRILVMDAGKAVEFDAPHVLVERKGYLNSMINETGPIMAEALREVARQTYENRTSTTL